MKRALVALAAALASVVGAGCIEDLDPKHVVNSPRILDVIADPPEATIGGRINLRAILGAVPAGERVEYEWTVCLSPDASGIPVGGFGTTVSEEGCFGSAAPCAITLGTGPTATLPVPPPTPPAGTMCGMTELPRDGGLPGGGGGGAGGLPMCTDEALAPLRAAFGPGLTCETLRRLLRDIGLVVKVGVVVRVGGRTLRAVKRVVVSTSERPNTNPPPPRLRFGTQQVVAADDGSDTCRAMSGEPIVARRDAEYELAPEPEQWLEPHVALSAAGEFQERTETAYYSWYTTGGNFARNITRSPIRNNMYRAPPTPGTYALWVLVRDGRGGSSGCHFDVRVE